MACCLLLAALFTHINEWLHRRGLYALGGPARRTNPFPTLDSQSMATPGGSE